ncbi:pyridoxamine 5'-phosphate oxidase family protein [Patescibacteria group bacterium]|nr:pyridoxamine 5'-phosphate oxidase family protein [Patescibacteria group bacterium]
MITKQQAAVEAMKFLKSHTVGTLATSTIGGQPSVSPIYYGIYDDFSIYFVTSKNTQKYKNIISNGRVAFSVGAGPRYRVVSIHGTAHLVGHEHRDEAIRYIEANVGTPIAEWPISTIKSFGDGELQLLKISPTHVSYLDLSSQDQQEAVAKFVYEILP